jgi:hypothetical protein
MVLGIGTKTVTQALAQAFVFVAEIRQLAGFLGVHEEDSHKLLSAMWRFALYTLRVQGE